MSNKNSPPSFGEDQNQQDNNIPVGDPEETKTESHEISNSQGKLDQNLQTPKSAEFKRKAREDERGEALNLARNGEEDKDEESSSDLLTLLTETTEPFKLSQESEIKIQASASGFGGSGFSGGSGGSGSLGGSGGSEAN